MCNYYYYYLWEYKAKSHECAADMYSTVCLQHARNATELTSCFTSKVIQQIRITFRGTGSIHAKHGGHLVVT